MSIFDDFVDAVEDVGEAVGDAISDAVDWVGDAVSDAVDWAEEAVSDVGDAIGDAAEALADASVDAIDALGDASDSFLTALEDSGFFDVVEFGTLGLVDMEYSDAGFSFEAGIEDVFGVGFQVGEGGFAFDVDAVVAGTEITWDDNGFAAEASAGIDWGPLPNVSAHMGVDEEGQFGIGGKAEAYVPTFIGLTGGEIGADYQETPDGFRVSGSITARNWAPTGTMVGAGVHASYEENAEGYVANVGVHGEVEQLGGPSVYGSLDYNESRQGDVRSSGVSAQAEAEIVPGAVEIGGSVGYEHVETSQGDFDVVSGEAYVEAAGASAEADVTVAGGPDGVTVTGGVSGDPDLIPDAEAVLGEVADAAGIDLPEVPAMPEVPEIPEMPVMLAIPDIPIATTDEVSDAGTEELGDAVDSAAEQLGS